MIALLLFIFMQSSPRVDAAAMQSFEEANRLCREAETSEDFQSAAARLQGLLDRGFVSGAVLYNQGNAWMRAGEPGRAIASYRHAMEFRPRDELLAANLALALRQVKAPPATRTLFEHIFFWQGWLSLQETVWATLALATATFLSGLFAFWRRGFRVAAWAGLGLTALALVSTAFEARETRFTEHGVVVAEQVVARKGDSNGFAPAFNEPLTEGAEFEVLERRGDWLHVSLAKNLDGWVRAEDVATY